MPKPKKVGNRKRFSGFFLGPSPRDRTIAAWIDEQPNASEAIKQIIHAVATGQAIGFAARTKTSERESVPELDPTDKRVQVLAQALDT